MSARRLTFVVGGLLLAWVGVWGTWLAHATAGLTQAALDLAEVSERLPDVLYGRLGYVPGLLRVSVGLLSLALSLAGGQLAGRAVRWVVRALALAMILRLVPPYPQVLALWRSPDYGGRFVLSAVMLAGWLLTLTGGRWPDLWRRGAMLALALAALIGGVWAYAASQRAFESSTMLPFSPGWGLGVYVAGLLVAGMSTLVEGLPVGAFSLPKSWRA